MNSYIEPRLLALLQHESLEPYTLTSLELPPLQDPNIIKASGRPLLLEPDASKRNGEPNTRPHLASKHSHLLPSIDDQENAYKSNETKQKYGDNTTDRALGGSSPQSLRKILDDDTETTLGGSSKKRHIIDSSKDDFVQLPQPPKKQKTAAPPGMPPMINGIHSLPPQAAMLPMLPPIASSSFHDSHGRNSLNTMPPKAQVLEANTGNASSQEVLRNEPDEEDEQDQPNDPSEYTSRNGPDELCQTNDILEDIAKDELDQPNELPKNTARNEPDVLDESHQPNDPEPQKAKRRRNNRKRQPWLKEESDALMLGVQKHGVGSWTEILKDPNFSKAFRCKYPGGKDRTAADLKDRFRTCCPPELRGASSSRSPSQDPIRKEKPKSSLMYENILIDDEEARIPAMHGHEPEKQRRSRAHRAQLGDLAELGIKGPFAKSSRRERRNFTQEEDSAILAGWHEHGAQWSRIQRDPRFNLQARTPTDLRDRFRNKYRDLFEKQKAKGKTTSTKQPSNRNSSEPRSKDGLSSGPGSSSNLYLQGQETESRTNETPWTMKENLASSAPQPPTLQSFSSREGLRIQEIISSDQQLSKTIPLQQQNPIYSFKDTFNPYAEQQSVDGLPFTQSQDWDAGITAPFPNEMDISRLLLNEVTTWHNDLGESSLNGMQGMGGKEKQSFTDINSILSSNAEPMHNLPSFLTMLNHDGPIEDMNEAAF